MNISLRNILFSLFALSYGENCAGFEEKTIRCNESEVAIYNLKFEARWSKKEFPKQYPEWRPPAQWSKLIGVTHDENYILFRIGEIASENLKTFAETGKIDITNNQSNVESHIYDEFSSPPVKSGVGNTEVNFFADGNHSMVSVAIKMIPSPDWFVGIDAFNLCGQGKWIDSVTIEAGPIDAGTDNGFTFTAPNWKTEPQEKIYKITSRYPRHPANSFYYPKLLELPPIATLKIQKKNLYRQIKTPPNEEKIDQLSPKIENFVDYETDKIISAINSTIDENIQKDAQQVLKKRKNVNQSVKCITSEWSQWSECSSTCGNGLSTRTRKIIRGKKSRQCPHLKEEKTCLADSECSKNYFKW